MASNRSSFPKGKSGNPAEKAPGARNRVTRDLEALLDDEGEAIVRKAVAMAKDGDPVALRLVLDRLVPPRRERRIAVDLPPIETPADAVKAAAAIVARVASGDLTMSEGEPDEASRQRRVHARHVRTGRTGREAGSGATMNRRRTHR